MSSRIRSGLFFTTFVVTVLCPCLSLRAGSTVPLPPVNGKTITVVINGEEKDYYVLDKNSPLALEVDGPGKLTLINRLCLTGKSVASEPYSIKVMEGKNTLKIHTTETDRS